MQRRVVRQRRLFEDDVAIHLPRMPEGVREEVIRLLSHWLVALAKELEAEVADDQDHP